jgi:beta-lactamase regulating signal transducer with metallopeptidase domain
MSFAAIEMPLQAVFQSVWQTSLAATVLIVLVMLALLVSRNRFPPRWRYGLWLLVLARLLWPVTPPASFSIFNLAHGLWPSTGAVAVAPSTAAPPDERRIETENSAVAPSPSVATAAEHLSPTAKPPPIVPWERVNIEPPPARASIEGDWRTVLPILWLLGAVCYGSIASLQHRRLARWVGQQSASRDTRLTATVNAARSALQLKCDVPAIVTNQVGSPAVFGWWRPRLLLPATAIEELDDQALRHVVLHELIHIQRRDVLLNWVVVLAQALHWFNPVVWLAMRRLRAERELACDAAVLRHLSFEEHRAYGSTLLKLAAGLCRPLCSPSLAPIFHRKHEIERRITMIAQFKPASRLATLIAFGAAATLAGLTFTGGAEKSTASAGGSTVPAVVQPLLQPGDDLSEHAPKHFTRIGFVVKKVSASDAPAAPTAPTHAEDEPEAQQRALKVLREALEKKDDEIRQRQAALDEMRRKLRIPQDDPAVGRDGGSASRLEALRVEVQAEHTQMETLYRSLTNMSRAEMKRALPTACPDEQLTDLFKAAHTSEQKLAEIVESYGSEHPEVKRTRRVLETVNRQIEDRLDGILMGIKAKLAATKAKAEWVLRQSDVAKAMEVEQAIDQRPYFQAKRDLETLQLVRERLQLRLIQEEIDGAMPAGVKALGR